MNAGDGLVPRPAPSLDELAATDAALDQFGALTWSDGGPSGPPAPTPRPTDDRILDLLRSLRDDVEPAPVAVAPLAPAPPLAPVVPLAAARWARTRRVAVAGVVAGAVLSVSGVAAAAGAAHPGGALFGLHRALFGQTASEAAESAVIVELQRARRALHAGDRGAAEEHVRRAASRLAEVTGTRRDALAGQLASVQPQVTTPEPGSPEVTATSPAESATDEPTASPSARPRPTGSAADDSDTAGDGAAGGTSDEPDAVSGETAPAQRHHVPAHRRQPRRPAPARTSEPGDTTTSDGHASTGEPSAAPTPETGEPTATSAPGQ